MVAGHAVDDETRRDRAFRDLDDGCHAFLLDTATHPAWQQRGIGVAVVEAAVSGARRVGCEWLHVDFEPGRAAFHLDGCGSAPTAAGLIRLRPAAS